LTASSTESALSTSGITIEPIPIPTPTVLPTPKPSPPLEGLPFIPRTVKNNIFSVTVSNLEELDLIKGFYKPASGNQYVIVYLSQTNISDEIQIYTGTFSLLDENNKVYDYIEGLSNFWLVILKPGGTNFGYLVFELPTDAHPANLVLHTLNQKPLIVNLR
jgi:hypothetical protein